MEHTPSARVGKRAARQWGVVSRAQLHGLDISGATVDVWVRRGRLVVLHRGVYAVGHAALRRDGRWLAAVPACGEAAALSHVSAAAHLHRSRSLDARDTTNHHGIPITTVPRTLLDLAAGVQAHRLERALAQAERLRLYDHRGIEDVLSRANGHRGRTPLTQATAQEPTFTRSELEAWFLALIRDAGVDQPLVNFALTAPDHPRLEVDFCWPQHRLIVEFDGWESHRARAAFEQDRRRDAALQEAGWRVLRFTWREDPTTIQRRLQALMHH
jgi:Protein of unknown function (DUF559)/Transcriptional regulator, AbiEi antitoxin